MFGYIVRRLIGAVLVIVVTSMLVFALFFAGPSEPARSLCQADRCTPERLALINSALGYDQSVANQYLVWAKGVFQGRTIDFGGSEYPCPAPCLGISFQQRIPVLDILKDRFPATLSIALGAAVIYLVIGVGLGVLAARKRGTATDRMLVGSTLMVSSIPYYLLALLAYLYLISSWGVFPSTGYTSPFENPIAWVSGLLLPWLILGLAYSTQYARFSRGSMVEALSEDYVRTAKAKGLAERKVLKHALRAAIVPVVTIFGLDIAGLLAGTVFTEQIFSINGIGRTALTAIRQQDLPIISATVLIGSFLVVVANLIVDVVYSVIDPRVRLT